MKTIYLNTNVYEFANDIAEEIRLFFDIAEVVFEKPLYDGYIEVIATVNTENDHWTGEAKIIENNITQSEYSFNYALVKGDKIVTKRHKKRCIKIAVFRALKHMFPTRFVPWGSLTGIRPTKLLHELESEMTPENAKAIMTELFDVSDQKYAVAKEIVDIQTPIINSVKDNDIDIYIGVPYCKTKCLYCSFPSAIRTDKTDMRSYIDALKRDIYLGSQIVKEYGYNVRSSYMGGGTPTVLCEDELYEVLDWAKSCYGTFGGEFTVEAGRPDTITKEKLKILRDMGANRISVNPQTMNDKTLELIGRSHTAKELVNCYSMALDLNFLINMDIIIGLPGEGISEVKNTLSAISDMNPQNLTVHTLALKKSSKLMEIIHQKDVQAMLPDAELANEMVELGLFYAYNMKMKPYYMYRQKYMRGNLENIGYATPGSECIYNIDMMEETVSIMAHGAGSMSKRIFNGRTLRVERIPNPKDIQTYINKLDKVYEDKLLLYKR